jgi:threonine dehydratase
MQNDLETDFVIDPSTWPLPNLDEIRQARDLISKWVIQPPVLTHPMLNLQLGCEVFFLPECLQPTGAFKVRGAFHFLSRLSSDELKRGVVAFSSGNHAQAVAYAANCFGIQATIVMPADAPVLKVENTRGWGAEVVLYDRLTENREAIAREIQQRSGAVLIPPFDHPWTITGQGTAALDLLSSLDSKGQPYPEMLLIPTSGGGLLAGCNLVISALSPETKVFAVEPEGYDDTIQSLLAKQRIQLQLEKIPDSICDSLLMTTPGELTFLVNQAHCAGGLVVSKQAVLKAMKWLFLNLKLVVEPGGAVGFAAMMSQPEMFHGKRVAVILSGGNVDPLVFQEALQS